jgi:hypothetical protein
MSSPKRYDYKRETSEDLADLDEKLTQHGQQGWELVNVVFDGNRFIAFLKRKIKRGPRHAKD